MNIYVMEDNQTAVQISQLLKLNAECVKLHWSRTITDVPQEVKGALEVIELYIEDKIRKECNQTSMFMELSNSEEDEMMNMLRMNPELRKTLGVGVVLSGKEAKEVMLLIKKERGLLKIKEALKTGKNVVLF